MFRIYKALVSTPLILGCVLICIVYAVLGITKYSSDDGFAWTSSIVTLIFMPYAIFHASDELVSLFALVGTICALVNIGRLKNGKGDDE